VVTRAQLLRTGLDSKGISRRAGDGRLHRLHRGVYAVGHPVLVPNGRRLAAVLACGPGAALSHGSAAALHGLWRSSGRMHVTVPRGGPHTGDGITVHRTRRLDPADVTAIEGIAVTTVARTALDLAEHSNPRMLMALLERADELELFDLREITACIDRNPGRRGITPLREALDLDMPGESELQRRFLRLCRDAGLPEPEREVQLGAYRADFFWPRASLVVETDGRSFHDRRAAFESDRERDLDLAAAGIRTLRVTWRMLTAPSKLIATLRALTGFGSI
jgi:very-short-patch-repair endonuclease